MKAPHTSHALYLTHLSDLCDLCGSVVKYSAGGELYNKLAITIEARY